MSDEDSKTLTTAAIDDASLAFSKWSRTGASTRETIIRRFAHHVSQNAESLTQLIMREVGKLRSDAAAEVAAVVAKAEITIEMMHMRRPDLQGATKEIISQARYRPLGVVVVLGPFNFPAHLPGGHIIPAILAGNTVVFKPSELAAQVGEWIVDAWRQSGLPDNVVRLIQGDASVAKSLIDDDRIAGVFFTGSHAAGVSIHRQLAGRPEVLLALEMGGNNPLVIVPPHDVDDAARLITLSAFVSAGQRCTCARRLIVTDDAFGRQTLERLVEFSAAMKPGLPDDGPNVDLGPVVSSAAADRLLRYQESWIASGGKPLAMMARSDRSPMLLSPGIIDMTDVGEIADEEWFGPLLQVYRVADFDAAIERANTTRFGLAAGMIGGTEEMFERFRRDIYAGIVNWNLATTGASSRLPFGGIGASGNHRPAGSFAIDFCNDPVASMIANEASTPREPTAVKTDS